MVLISITCLELTDVFSFIICLDEKFRKELHQKHYLAVMNAFLRKLIFLSFTVKILLLSYPSYVFLYEMFKIVDVCFCAVMMLAQWDVFYLMMFAELSFFPQDGDKKGFSYCANGSKCTNLKLKIVKGSFVYIFLFIILLISYL